MTMLPVFRKKETRCWDYVPGGRQLDFVKWEKYNWIGELICAAEWDGAGHLVSREYYAVNENMNHTIVTRVVGPTRTRYSYDADGTLQQTVENGKNRIKTTSFQYNEQGVLCRQTVRDAYGAVLQVNRMYRKTVPGGEVRIKVCRQTGGTSETEVRRYAEPGYLQGYEWYRNRQLYLVKQYFYDDAGRMVRELVRAAQDGPLDDSYFYNGHGTERIFIYDGDGLHRGTITKNGTDIIRRVRKRYTSRGLKICKEVKEGNGAWYKEYVHHYGANWLVVRTVWYVAGKRDAVSEYRYEY